MASIVGISCAIVAFIMRMASKLSFSCVPGSRVDADLWWDDLAITLAMVMLFPISILSNILNKLGIGKDVRGLNPEVANALKDKPAATARCEVRPEADFVVIPYRFGLCHSPTLPGF